MAIAFVAGGTGTAISNTGTNANGTTTLSVVMPAGIQANDYAFIVLSKDNNSAIATHPTGFQAAASGSTPASPINAVNATTLQDVNVWHKRLVGNESGTTLTTVWNSTAYASMTVVVYRDVHLSNGFDVTTTTGTKAAASSTQTYPAITTATDNAMLLYISGTVGVSANGPFTHTAPAVATERADTTSQRTQTTNTGLEVSDRLTTTLGTYTAVTGSSSITTTDVTLTIALREDLTQRVITDSIPSDEAFSNAFIQVNQNSFVPTIGSQEAFGNPFVQYGNVVYATSIGSQEAFGNPLTKPVSNVYPTSFVDGVSDVGTPFINANKYAIPTTIPTQEAFGAPFAQYGNVVYATSVQSQEAFGSPFVNAQQVVKTIGIDDTVTAGVGTPKLNQQQIVIGTGIITQEALGTPLTKGSTIILPTSISGDAIGTPYIKNIAYAIPTAIASTETFGSTLLNGRVTILPTSIDGTVAGVMGTPLVKGSTRTIPTAIASQEAFSVPRILQPAEAWGFLSIL